MAARRRTILVAGGGIAGLTAALCLARDGWRVELFEQAQGFETVGAGLQISPNAYRIIDALGQAERLKLVATGPSSIRIRSGHGGRELAQVPLGSTALDRYGAPYLVVHRADLQQVLAAAAHDDPDIDIHMGSRLEDATSHPNGVTGLSYGAGTMREHTASALIAADGVWSELRKRVFGAGDAVFSGYIAWRGLVPAASLPGSFDLGNVQLFMAADAHVVAYPVRGARYLNLVAVTKWKGEEADRPGRSWAHEANAADLTAELAKWCPEVKALVAERARWTKWPLFGAPAMPSWAQDNAALIGDAAHGMLPFAAQGAAMGIEDAAVLALRLRPALAGTAETAECLAGYSRDRMGRVERARRLALSNRTIYHLPAPLAAFRDIGMWALGGRRLLARQDWLYGWKMPEEAGA